MGFLSRENLLKKDVLKIEKVELGNGDFVYVRQLTGHENDQFQQSLYEEHSDADTGIVTLKRNMVDFRARLAVYTVCDDKGKLLLSPMDFEELSNNKSAAVLSAIVRTAQKLNNITEEDAKKMEGNSGAGQSVNSGSDSAGS